MVNANEWLNNKIPADERKQAEHLYVYSKCQCINPFQPVNYQSTTSAKPSASVSEFRCQRCDDDQDNQSYAPNYEFYSSILEGELDLNDFVNLRKLHIIGAKDEDMQQKLTTLKVDNCAKLTDITINYTTLGRLSFGSKPNFNTANFFGNKTLVFCDFLLKNQIERLTNMILTAKEVNFGDLKFAIKKNNEENFKHQLQVFKSNLDMKNLLWLESFLKDLQEILQLSEVLTTEEIQDILNKTRETNELKTQLNKLGKLLTTIEKKWHL
ncbi:hypothetical protein F8M41_015475 [Gigaspora margarita]|uniref:Uncharacterized protein n=1 Tax=Gigaspora margarita TaxID=4874 RepID=A0A8H4AQS5_GIGMA|nr:hypothetical protein F8M41_015475 [Gigaspora margarita]